MRRSLLFVLAWSLLLTPLLWTTSAQAQEGSSWWRNPFRGSGRNSGTAAHVTDDRGWMPSLPQIPLPQLSMPSLPWQNNNRNRNPNRPGPLTRLNNGARAVWNTTTDVLTPWDNAPRSNRNRNGSSGFRFPWQAAPNPSRPAESVNDFLSQPRVPPI